MATITLAAAIRAKLESRTSEETLKDLTRQRDTDATTVDTDLLDDACLEAASEVEGVLGTVGTYDDGDDTVGDQVARRYGIRLVWKILKELTGQEKPDDVDAKQSILDQLRQVNTARIQAAPPVIKKTDNTDLNKRFKSSEWPSED